MAFPTTGLIDNFNRANESPIALPWVNSIYSGDDPVHLVSNAIKQTLAGWASVYYGATTYGPDCEIYFRVATAAAESLEFAVRITGGDTSSPTYYSTHISNVGGWGFYRSDGGIPVAIGSEVVGPSISAGDELGMEAIGSNIAAYHKPSGGSWTLINSHTDANITGAGNIGVFIPGTLWVLDDFSGGNAVVPLPVRLRPDADLATTGWSTAPLFSKVNEETADGVEISASN